MEQPTLPHEDEIIDSYIDKALKLARVKKENVDPEYLAECREAIEYVVKGGGEIPDRYIHDLSNAFILERKQNERG